MTGDRGKFAGALGTAAAFVVGFVPWIVYWILVGNTPFLTAVLVALALSLVVNLYAIVRRRPLMVLEVGTVAVFAVLVVLGLVLSDDTIERWMQPLGNLGLFLIVLISVLIGKPFTLQYAKQSTPPAQWNEPGFLYVCQLLAWVWVVAMGFMTVVAAIPPIVDGDATVMDADDTLSIVCYWVLPYVALGVAMLFTMKFPDWFVEAAGGDEPAPTATTTPAPAPVAASPATAHLAGGAATTLTVDPDDVLADATANVRVTGVPTGASVVITAETVDLFGHRWHSQGSIPSTSDGTIDLATATPTSGTWTTADPNALIWSMTFAATGAEPDVFIPSLDPAVTVVTASVAGATVQSSLVRRVAGTTAAAVTVRDVRAPGVVGRLFVPDDGTARLPGVVLFPGSEGGLDSQGANAALLASHGCVALVAATFSSEDAPLTDVPASLQRVPLERFGDAIRWLAGHERVDQARVSAMSISRGAEGLLAAASRIDDLPLRLVVAVSPSSLTWVALGEKGSIAGVPAWTVGGDDLPAVDTDDRALMADIAREALRRRGRAASHGPAVLHLRRAYEGSVNDPAATGAAAIAAEDIVAPLLLVSGSDDGLWPSTVMAQRLLDRRRSASTPAAAHDQLLTYPGAGHFLRLGCWPTTVTATGGFDLGGTAAGLAAAQADLTPRVVAAVTA